MTVAQETAVQQEAIELVVISEPPKAYVYLAPPEILEQNRIAKRYGQVHAPSALSLISWERYEVEMKPPADILAEFNSQEGHRPAEPGDCIALGEVVWAIAPKVGRFWQIPNNNIFAEINRFSEAVAAQEDPIESWQVQGMSPSDCQQLASLIIVPVHCDEIEYLP